MPKIKTHRGAAKRYRSPAPARSGAARRSGRTCWRRSPRSARAVSGRGAEVTGGDKKHVERLLGRA